MNVLFLGSELDNHTWQVAKKIKKDVPRTRYVKSENVNDLLSIKSNSIILFVSKNLINPKKVQLSDIKNNLTDSPADLGVLSFLESIKKLGRLTDIEVIGVPEQMDADTLDAINSLIGDLLEF